jgi:hypothetical protein
LERSAGRPGSLGRRVATRPADDLADDLLDSLAGNPERIAQGLQGVAGGP